MKAMDGCLSDTKSSQLMGGVAALKLGCSLNFSPASIVQLHHVGVQSLGQQWAAGDGSPRPVQLGVLAISFVKNVCPDCVELCQRCTIYVAYHTIQKENKVDYTFLTKLEEMKAGDGEEVQNCCSHAT